MSIEFLIKYLMQQTSEAENQQVENWLKTNEKNQAYLDELRVGFEKEAPQITLTDDEVAQDWQKVKAKLREKKAQPPTLEKSNSRNIRRVWITRVAAVVLIGLAIGLIYQNFTRNQSNTQKLLTIQAKQLNKQIMVLADGTKVWLNRGSRLHYPKVFDATQRQVRLEGEGYFEVKKDENRPFIVQTSKVNIAVLGTSFNIRQQTGLHTKVTVNSGKVAVATPGQKQRVVLIKGEMSDFDVQKGQLTKQTNQDLNYLSWKTGQLVFKNATMEQIVEDLRRHFNVSLDCTPALRQKFSFNGTFQQQSLEQILQVIELTLDVKVSKTGDSILIK